MSVALKSFRYPNLYEHLSEEVMKLTGVQLGAKQRSMVETRLQKRIHDLGFRSLEEYQGYFESHEKEEIQNIVSLLTTHYTYFFREFAHFEFLSEKVLPDLIAEVRKRPDRTLRVWSAAASRGQEVYSLAMYLLHHLKSYSSDVKLKILGTDVDAHSIRIAKNGVYPRREIREVPLMYLGNHWARGTGEIADFVKAKSSLKEFITFEHSNLLDSNDRHAGQTFDLIFCRNVFIYFTPEQVKSSTQMLLNHLDPKGYFFIGLSESLNGMGFDLRSAGPSVYCKPQPMAQKEVQKSPGATVVSMPTRTQSVSISPASLIRVLCVDDSSSIHSLMKQILKKENGFEIVGTAMNGLEAAAKLKALGKGVDVMTLDIHMPEQDGVEYLTRNFGPDHPPVVMVSSVSRDQSDLSLKTLKLGASDYVEKPALNALQERGEELRAKLKTAVLAKGQSGRSLNLDEQFKKQLQIKDPQKKVRVISTGLAHLKKTAALVKDCSGGQQPPVYLLFEGVEGNLPQIAQELKFMSGVEVRYSDGTVSKGRPGEIIVMDFKKAIPFLSSNHSTDRMSIAVMGEIGRGSAGLLTGLKAGHMMLEDLGNGKGAEALQSFAKDVFPATSFPYLGSEFFGKE
jgi:chemotaxis protein methyltransferase CheR